MTIRVAPVAAAFCAAVLIVPLLVVAAEHIRDATSWDRAFSRYFDEQERRQDLQDRRLDEILRRLPAPEPSRQR